MTETTRKIKGSLSMGKLEIACEAHEQFFGDLVKLEALGAFTIATYDDGDFPAEQSLALLPSIGGSAPHTPAGAAHLFDGQAMALGQKIDVSAFRTT